MTFTEASKTPESYHFWHLDNIRFNDLDALGHVSSVSFNAYFAGARTKLFQASIENWPHCNPLPVLRASEIEYLSELHFPGSFEIGLDIEKFGTTSFTINMALFVDSDCAALCRNIFVFYDRDKQKKAAIPPVAKDRFINETSGKKDS